jgi:hypothetical protein
MSKDRVIYSVKFKGPKNENKTEKAKKNYEHLLVREKKEGVTTKWMKNAKEIAAKRLVKYGIKIPTSVK